ncbi:hypothetical protein [Maricaulis sp. CAU 1757]
MKTIPLISATALALALGSAVHADHGHGEDEADGPTAEACREMHTAMMARHEAGESHDDIMASLDGEGREMARACHALMQAEGHAHGAGHGHGEGHGHGDGHGQGEGHAHGMAHADGQADDHGEHQDAPHEH